MIRRPGTIVGATVVVAGWTAVAGLAGWTGRQTPVADRGALPRSVLVMSPAGSPGSRDWAHFFACSGLAGDPSVMRATLLLNGGGDDATWRQGATQDTPVRLALHPATGELSPAGDKIISDAPGAVADCGVMP